MSRPTRRDLLMALSTVAVGSAASATSGSLGGASTLLGYGEPARMTADRFDWFDRAKLGLFVHWGPYSLAGVEASWPIMVPGLRKVLPQPAISEDDYVSLASRFDPREFDPEGWVRQAERAGMRYIVLTAKHHDGFCMFDAPGTDYKVTASPYGSDICAELAEACAKRDMRLGFYYSPPDMHDPGYRDTSQPSSSNWTGQPDRPEWSGYLDRMEDHLRKLLSDYGPVSVIWFDGLFDHDRYQPERMVGAIRDLSPETLVNDRLGPGDYITPEQFFPTGIPVKSKRPTPAVTEEAIKGFFDLLLSDRSEAQMENLLAAAQAARFPTKLLPDADEFQRWETCLTMNRTWAYNPSDTEWKSTAELIRTLVEVASRGGNLLLNVGPSPTGSFPSQALERLDRVGQFLDRYGPSIHDTTWGPVQGHDAVLSTERDGVVYLHVETASESMPAAIEIADYPRSVSRISEYPGGKAVDFTLRHGTLSIHLDSGNEPNAKAPRALALYS